MIKNIIDRWLTLNSDPNPEVIKALQEDLKNNSILELEEIIKEKKAESKRIESRELLEYMEENDLEIFENEAVKGKTMMYVSATQGGCNKELLFNWLSENGYKDIIKDGFQFSKGDADEKLLTFLKENGYSYERSGTVAAQSLKKVVSGIIDHNQNIEEGEELKNLPGEDMCKISYYNYVKIKKK